VVFAFFPPLQCIDNRSNGIGPSAVNSQRLLRQRAAWIGAGFDFGNEPIGTIIGE